MALPPEKLAELKQIIHNQLVQANITSQIRDALKRSLKPNQASNKEEVSEGQILNDLKSRGVVNEILQHLKFESPIISSYVKPATDKKLDEELISVEPQQKVAVHPNRRYLFLHILGGKAFLEHLNAPAYPGNYGDANQQYATFTLHILFCGQRFRSQRTPVACEPNISEGFLLELPTDIAGEASRMIRTETMLSLCDPVHLVMTRTDVDGTISLVASHSLEWRKVLCSSQGSLNLSIEMMGVGTECKVPVGVLETRLEIVPLQNFIILSKEVVETQQQLERRRSAEKERLFLVYAKQWWKEYLQIRDAHRTRAVKIFAQDETGMNRPVCSFVKPIRAGRLLQTSRQAARFVSAFGYERAPTVGTGSIEQWRSTHAFFCLGKGDHEDHSNLLCSLLLGFGLDAYVCVGTNRKGISYTWVMTKYSDGATVVFWDAVTGHRYIHHLVFSDDPPAVKQPISSHPFKTIGCVYSHESFYANCQPNHSVDTCSFSLADSTQWKPMSYEAIRTVCGLNQSTFPPIPSLLAPTLDSALASSQLEAELRLLVREHRMDLELSTEWDDHLCYVLSPALVAYESERISGSEPPAAGNEEFQEAVRRAVPEGHTFKGFPIQFLHRNARRAFATCLKNPICSEIIGCRGGRVRLAVRVNVFVFPEDAVATWVMFACKYESIL